MMLLLVVVSSAAETNAGGVNDLLRSNVRPTPLAEASGAPWGAKAVPYREAGTVDPAQPTNWQLKWEMTGDTGGVMIYDLGAFDAELPQMLGLPRFQRFTAQKSGNGFVVAGGDFNSLFNRILNHGLLRFAPEFISFFGRFTDGEEFDVHEARMTITSAGPEDARHLALDYAIDVTIRKDEIQRRSTIRHRVMVEPILMNSRDAAEAVLGQFGTLMPAARRTAPPPDQAAQFLDEAGFVAKMVESGLNPAEETETTGFTSRLGPVPVAYIRPGAPPFTTVHEATHVYGNPKFREMGKYINEGATQILASRTVTEIPNGHLGYKFYGHYGPAMGTASQLMAMGGFDKVAAAYFGSGCVEILALRQAIDADKGPGTFARFLNKYDGVDGNDTNPDNPLCLGSERTMDPASAINQLLRSDGN